MKKERRWIKSIIAASTEAQVALPWARSTRRRPAALKDQAKPGPRGRCRAGANANAFLGGLRLWENTSR